MEDLDKLLINTLFEVPIIRLIWYWCRVSFLFDWLLINLIESFTRLYKVKAEILL